MTLLFTKTTSLTTDNFARWTVTLIMTIVLGSTVLPVWGQQTPEEFGKLVFNVFKTHDTLALDTMNPTCNQIIEIYSQIDSSQGFFKDSSFPRKYAYHDRQFKEKCKLLMSDSILRSKEPIYDKLNWKNAVLINTEFLEKEVKAQDSAKSSKSFKTNYLNIYFLSSGQKFQLQFKMIYKYKNVWKLGESVRIRTITDK